MAHSDYRNIKKHISKKSEVTLKYLPNYPELSTYLHLQKKSKMNQRSFSYIIWSYKLLLCIKSDYIVYGIMAFK